MKLVAFYSRAGENYFGGQYRVIEVGNTEKVAKTIAALTGAELFQIRQVVPYARDYQTCIRQAQEDKRANARPELAELPENLEGYDQIYLGYPNYWGDLPMAVYTFLESFDWTGKTLHPFCTHEGSGLGGTVQSIARTCKGAHVKNGLAVWGSDADNCLEKVASWMQHDTTGGAAG